MSKQKAKSYFLGADGCKRLNCGQAIIGAFKDKFSLSEETVEGFSGFGGGHAPQGLCGALYAVEVILEKNMPDKLEECSETFFSLAGSKKCKEIKKLGKLSCLACVEEAACLLEGCL